MPLLLLVTALLASVAGCSDLGIPLRPRAQPEVSSTTLDFGTLALSDSAHRTVTLTNAGTAALAGIVAVSCPEYSLVSGGGPFNLPPGGSRTITLKFQPSAAGTFPCVLDLGPNAPRISIQGVGALQAPGARCIAVPDSLDLGLLKAGQSNLASFTLYSVGTAPLFLNVVSGCSEFSVLEGSGPANVPPGGSVTVTVQFTPQSGGRRSCFIGSGPACPEVPVTGFATSVSFADEIQPIFQGWCEGCHIFGDIGDPTFGYSILTTARSNYPPGVMVVPFDLTNSVLYGKVTNSGQYGPLMPQGGPLLPQSDRDKIKTWILEGARDN